MSSGVHKKNLACDMPKKMPNEETTEAVDDFFEENPTSTIRRAAKVTKIPRSTVDFQHLLYDMYISHLNIIYFYIGSKAC